MEAGAPLDPGRGRPPSRAVYIALAVIGGSTGLHNFYARRFWQGAVQCALALPALWIAERGMLGLTPLFLQAVQGDFSAAETIALDLPGLLPSPWLVAGAAVSSLWAAVEIFAVKTDGRGRPLR